MRAAFRAVIIIACVLALWYLVVTLARSVARESSAVDADSTAVLAVISALRCPPERVLPASC